MFQFSMDSTTTTPPTTTTTTSNREDQKPQHLLFLQQQQHQQQHQQQQSTSGSLSGKLKRNPYCSRCRNHGKKAQVKGHKRHCEYRDCECEGCKLVEARQIISAAQIKRRRYQKQDEECGRVIEVSPPVLNSNNNNNSNVNNRDRQQANSPFNNNNNNNNNNCNTNTNTAATIPFVVGSQNNVNNNNNSTNVNNNNNTLSLIAKTLIGPIRNSKQHQSHRLNLYSPQQQLQQQQQQNHHQQNNHQDASFLAAAVAAASTAQKQLLSKQINFVEDIYQTYGPLAIFAWLKAEQFDLQKIFDLIEQARNQFDELLQITGHSPLDLTSPVVD